MTFKPIIHVGLDSSWRETGALEWALQESLLRHQPLRAVHVLEDKLRHTPYWRPTVVEDAAMELVKDVQTHLDARPDTIDHEMDLVAGSPARTLNELAKDGQMLVVGRRGIGAFKRLLIGSTSEQVASEASAPVVVVPDEWQPAAHRGPVLIGLDDDAAGNHAAIEFAVAAALERKVSLRMVHVWDLPTVYSWDAMNVAGVGDEWSANAEQYYGSVADQWRKKYPELTIEVEVCRGHAVDSVITAAEACDAQLLVVGGRRHHPVTSMLLGSVARGVLHHSTCPIAVVHASRDDS